MRTLLLTAVLVGTPVGVASWDCGCCGTSKLQKTVHGSGVKEVEGWQGAVSLCSVLLLLSYCDQLVWLLVVSYKEATLVLRYKQAGVHVANGMSGWKRAVE